MSLKGILSKLPKAIIDPNGVFKYIKINCQDLVTKESLFVVRGFNNCENHPDILDKFHGDYFVL